MVNIEHDQDKGGHADGQTENVDKRGDLIAPEDAEGDDQKTA
jgi:hypothetical protein